MPTTRVRRNRNRIAADGITEADYTYFSWGSFFEAEHYDDDKSEGELKGFWQTHWKAIMDRYLQEIRERGPDWYGCRPWPYWKWDVTEKRLRIPEDKRLGANGLYDPKVVNPDGMEADYAFLKRLNLLEPWEL